MAISEGSAPAPLLPAAASGHTDAAPTAGPSAPAAASVERRRQGSVAPRLVPWIGGLMLGLAMLGPGLWPGALLNLDLLVTPRVPLPPGLFGLGPALSQRVPLFGLISVVSSVLGGPVAVKAFIVAAIASGFVGMFRLIGRETRSSDAALAGLLWAGGPFAMVRLEVGHLGMLWVVAVLPWVLPRLCRASSSGWSTFGAVLALAVGGPAAGSLAMVAVLIALVGERGRRRPAVVALATLSASSVWVLPTVSLLWAGAQVAGADRFTTRASNLVDAAAVPGGAGFWLPMASPLTRGAGGAVFGLVVLVLAVVGRRGLDRSWGRVALAGLLLGVWGAVPALGRAYVVVSTLPVGAPLRESQRFLALWLVWACPSAVLGARRMADRLVGSGSKSASNRWADSTANPRRPEPVRQLRAADALTVVSLLAVLAWGWSGAYGVLHPVAFPPGWGRARALVRQDPGTVVVLPWSEYPPLRFAGGRQIFDPVPDFLGGDVISSFDPAFDPSRPAQEQVDPRSRVVDRIARSLGLGRPPGDRLARLGVRWVFVRGWRGDAVDQTLAADPTLKAVFADGDATLFAVRGVGPGPTVRRPISPVVIADAPAGTPLPVAAAPGWVRGWFHGVPATADGRLVMPAGGGPLWFWPALVIVLADLSVVGAVLMMIRRRHSEHPRQMPR